MKEESMSDKVKMPPIRQPEGPDKGLLNDSHHEGTKPEEDRGQVHRIEGNVPGMGGKSSGKYAGTM